MHWWREADEKDQRWTKNTEGESLSPGPEHQPLPPCRRRQSLLQMKDFSRLRLSFTRGIKKGSLPLGKQNFSRLPQREFPPSFQEKHKATERRRAGRVPGFQWPRAGGGTGRSCLLPAALPGVPAHTQHPAEQARNQPWSQQSINPQSSFHGAPLSNQVVSRKLH